MLGVAKFTPTGKDLKDWCLEMDATYNSVDDEETGRVDTSFASEAVLEDPTANTRMVT